MKSIIQSERICYITGRCDTLEEHHVFGGANRKNSEKYGLKIFLTRDMHTGKKGVHQNRELADGIRAEVQKKAMEYWDWTQEDFMRIFGKNYI